MRRLLAACLLAVLAGGCATSAPPPDERDPADPWEPYNRTMWTFNVAVDQAIVRPVAVGYDTVTPGPVQTGVRNFFTNLRSPVVIINLLLQGRGGDAGRETGRFLTNTVIGMGGLIDIASFEGMEKYNADFGLTLASWGWEDSRFFVLPFLGPSTVRDGLGRGADSQANIEWRLAGDGSYYLLGIDVIQTRAGLLPLDEQIRDAFDPYSFMRDGWLQRRNYLIHGEEAPLPDYDAMLDDEDW
ncbi:VacJ family lipoprotein [Wenzhouxiangella sp. AB-CW3]|uniref:MlaA family lipoprotein n=1 Tax=Wenzhouxiangella sp. AB-CW3 TaxID=2771012 RepID=UPI001CC2F9E6|nr:VacJ family lipoprotein [Wenzhouxiangella sp. AB-CW3]